MKRTLSIVLAVLPFTTMSIPAYASTSTGTSGSIIMYIDGSHPERRSNSSARGSIAEYSIPNVPTALSSNSTHLCIPCAISNIATYYSQSPTYPGYSGFGWSDQEDQAAAIQNAMGTHRSENDYINTGFARLDYSVGSSTYRLRATAYSSGTFSFYGNIFTEIPSDRPLLLGFAATSDTPYIGSTGAPGAHMTVCVGFLIDGNDLYVYVSDAWEHYYRLVPYSPDTYNDFIATVSIQVSST